MRYPHSSLQKGLKKIYRVVEGRVCGWGKRICLLLSVPFARGCVPGAIQYKGLYKGQFLLKLMYQYTVQPAFPLPHKTPLSPFTKTCHSVLGRGRAFFRLRPLSGIVCAQVSKGETDKQRGETKEKKDSARCMQYVWY